VHVGPDGVLADAATGLTAVVDVEVGPDGALYVTEFAAGFDAEGQSGWMANSGRLVRLGTDGGVEVVADGLNKPNGIAFDDAGNLYVTVDSDAPPEAGPQGRLLRFDRVARAS
jgi:sugar lactone lactonase YvrE